MSLRLRRGPFASAPSKNAAGDEAVIYQRSVILTNAQIKALHTTPVELVPAPAAGFLTDFIRIHLVSNIVDAYTNIGASSYLLFLNGITETNTYVNNNAVAYPSMLADLFGSSNWIGVSPAVDVDEVTTGGSQPNIVLPTDEFGALKIKLSNSGALTGGNAANTLRVTVVYTVIEV